MGTRKCQKERKEKKGKNIDASKRRIFIVKYYREVLDEDKSGSDGGSNSDSDDEMKMMVMSGIIQ